MTESVLCIALRRPVTGLSGGNVGSRVNPFELAPSPRGGGRLLATPGRGAGRDAMGSGTMGSSGRTRALKFLFDLKGVEGV